MSNVNDNYSGLNNNWNEIKKQQHGFILIYTRSREWKEVNKAS